MKTKVTQNNWHQFIDLALPLSTTANAKRAILAEKFSDVKKVDNFKKQFIQKFNQKNHKG